MKIAVDGNEANVSQKVGVSVYTLNLLKYFASHANHNTQFIVFLKNQPNDDLPPENKFYQYHVVGGNQLWSLINLPLALLKHKDINVFFSPAHYSPITHLVPKVVTIHDMSYNLYPQDFLFRDLIKLKYWTSYSLNTASKVIAVSKATKKDIIKFNHIPEDKINVIYNGYEKHIDDRIVQAKYDQKQRPYFLYVGTLQPRKNIISLVQAFYKIRQQYQDYQLIIAGKRGWLYQSIFKKVKELGVENDVYFTNYITDQQLMFLYKNAFALVLPSFYEGFGLPILEAMSYGCPVISSYSSSLPEIGGESALYFDPKRYYDLAEKMKELIVNPNLRKQLIKKGQSHVKFFSWTGCGKKTLEVIKSAVK